MISELVVGEIRSEKHFQAPEALITRDEILTLEPPERHAVLMAHLQSSLTQVMGAESSELDPQESLNALGLDSLMALELQHALETTLRVRLPIELLLGAPSLDDFVERLLEVDS